MSAATLLEPAAVRDTISMSSPLLTDAEQRGPVERQIALEVRDAVVEIIAPAGGTSSAPGSPAGSPGEHTLRWRGAADADRHAAVDACHALCSRIAVTCTRSETKPSRGEASSINTARVRIGS